MMLDSLTRLIMLSSQCLNLYYSCWLHMKYVILFQCRSLSTVLWISCYQLVMIWLCYCCKKIQPSESNTYADIEAIYECLETRYGVSQEDLILYGQSVGSGPTLHLAAKLPRLRGVVLHSGILSGLRVLCHVKYTLCFDIYKVRL